MIRYMALDINIDNILIHRAAILNADYVPHMYRVTLNIPFASPPSYANSTGVRPKFRRKVSAINAERFRFRVASYAVKMHDVFLTFIF